MGFLDIFRRKEERSDLGIPADAFTKLLSEANDVSTADALAIPAVASCVDLISDIIASANIGLYKRTEKGVEEVRADKRLHSLNKSAGNNLSGFQLKKNIVRDYLLPGGGYAYILRGPKGFEELYYVPNGDVAPLNSNMAQIIKDTYLMVYGQSYNDFEFLKVLNETDDGITGRGLLNTAALQLSIMNSMMKTEYIVGQQGGAKSGVVKSSINLDKESMAELRAAFNRMRSNQNTDKVLILNNGLDYQELSHSLTEMQMVENKRGNTDLICELFRVPKTILSGGTVANSNDKDYFIAFALMPVITAFEAALNRDLLLESEKSDHYFAFDLREIAKGSTTERYKAYTEAIRGGWLTPAEAREMENREPIEGLNTIRFNLSDVLYDPVTKTYFTPNTKDVSDGISAQGGNKIINADNKGDDNKKTVDDKEDEQ